MKLTTTTLQIHNGRCINNMRNEKWYVLGPYYSPFRCDTFTYMLCMAVMTVDYLY